MKIFVFGFAHSGTTILRKIIGDHPDIYDYPGEICEPPDMDNVVFKCPCLPSWVHRDCKRVMIIKNPFDIFGGYYLRYGDKYLSIEDHTIDDYADYVEYFLGDTSDYKIRYEDLFLPGRLESLFDWLGLEFTGIKKRDALCTGVARVPRRKPGNQREGEGHAAYRTWQINQPFRNMTGESARFLPEETRVYLSNHPVINKLYEGFADDQGGF